jgi:AcrR family transcriptional regulator
VSPKVADPALRMTLVETAARLIAEEGVTALTLRRLAREVGTSTMAVYTHFGGMDELRVEVRREGFARFAEHLDSVPVTRDPVFDLGLLGAAYAVNALVNPNLYWVMFMEPTLAHQDGAIGYETFERLVTSVDRGQQSGRFDPADPRLRARQVWAVAHGAVALHLSGQLDVSEMLDTLWWAALHLFIGFGDKPAAARRSMERARRAAQDQPLPGEP